MRFLNVCAAVLIAAVGWVGTARATDMEVSFLSNHPNIVDVQLFAQERSNVWPGGSRVWTLKDSDRRWTTISCHYGEKICYGAGVRGNYNRYWGVSLDNNQGCSNCCFSCEGGDVSFTLNP